MSEEHPEIPRRVFLQMKNAKTMGGAVGCRVKASGDNPDNQAWITVKMNQKIDSVHWKTTFLHYVIQYLELRADYDDELNGWDYDEFYVKSETYHNIVDGTALVKLLHRWIDDLEELQPAFKIGHPNPQSIW